MKKIKFKIIEKNGLFYLLCKRVGMYGFIMDYWKCIVNCETLEIFDFIGTKFALNYSQMQHLAYKNTELLEKDKKDFIEYIKTPEIYNKLFNGYYNKPKYILFRLVNSLPSMPIPPIESLKSIVIVLLTIALLLLIFK